MARKKQTRTTKKTKAIADQGVALAEYAATALVAAEQLGIKAKAVEEFPLSEEERTAVAHLPALAAKLKKKLVKTDGPYTVAEVAGMVMAIAESLVDAEPKQQVTLLLVAKKLMDCLQANITTSEPAASEEDQGDSRRHRLPVQDHPPRKPSPDLAANPGAGLHARQAA